MTFNGRELAERLHLLKEKIVFCSDITKLKSSIFSFYSSSQGMQQLEYQAAKYLFESTDIDKLKPLALELAHEAYNMNINTYILYGKFLDVDKAMISYL